MLCPEQVPLLQEARKKQRAIIGSNFVERKSERPTITLNDFLPLLALAPNSDVGASDISKKHKTRYSHLIPLSFCPSFSHLTRVMPSLLGLLFDRIRPYYRGLSEKK